MSILKCTKFQKLELIKLFNTIPWESMCRDSKQYNLKQLYVLSEMCY